MPIVAHEYLMSLTVLSANIKCRTVPIVADRADFVPGPQLQNGMEHELQIFAVTSSLRNVSEFVKICNRSSYHSNSNSVILVQKDLYSILHSLL